MRRFLTTLMILLVVVVAGLSALVMLVDPNDFRGYMVRQVAARSGYQLNLDGPLRWHIWPQLSILSGRMSLTAPGAAQPLVSADNMRLDVALLPLVSHQLQVRQVMLKRAVIQLTPQTASHPPAGAPVEPADPASEEPAERGWSFDVAKLSMDDSLLVFQHADDEQVTVRNINLQMSQNEKRQAHVELSSRITRDQRDLDMSLAADLDVSDFPHQLTADISQLNYALQGADLPAAGIRGTGSMLMRWQIPQQQFSLSRFHLTANDSDVQGDVALRLRGKPTWSANLSATTLNFDNLAVPNTATNRSAPQRAQQGDTRPRPVIADGAMGSNYHGLRDFDARVKLAAGAVHYRGLTFTDVQSSLINQDGLLTVAELAGKSGRGTLSLPGSIDARDEQPKLAFQPDVRNVDVGAILQAFHYPIDLTGLLSAQGRFTGDKLNAEAFRRSWQGDAQVTLVDSRLRGLNFQQLIQQAVSRDNASIKTRQTYDNITALNRFSAAASLDSGILKLDGMKGESNILALTGSGTLDLVKEQCDTQFNVQVTDGWQGNNSKLIEMLKTTAIPLRVYGPWQELNYNLQVDQILRKQLQDEAKRRLSEWADKHKDSGKAKDLKQLLDKL